MISEEKAAKALEELFERCGYHRYRMNKFEEYELYSKNKSFLPSQGILTFTDTDGTLMALKPDVTLSIIKNSKDGGATQKLYYNEHVYRPDSTTKKFSEITQIGLECIGDADAAVTAEVLLLARQSLRTVSNGTRASVLDVCHLGMLSHVTNKLGEFDKKELLYCINHKNVHGAKKICADNNAKPEAIDLLLSVMQIAPEPDNALRQLFTLDKSAAWQSMVSDMYDLIDAVGTDGIRIDFSVASDSSYYSGIVFRGYVQGVAADVLSGGQYGNLMKKMGKSSNAIGFAVYLDRLSPVLLSNKENAYDELIIYDESSDIHKLAEYERRFISDGVSFKASKVCDGISYRHLTDLTKERS